MSAFAKVFNFLAHRTDSLDRSLFEEAYGASEAFRSEVNRKQFEKAEAELLAVLPRFPLVWTEISKPAPIYPQTIANRLAFILLYTKADGHVRKYDKSPSWIHSAEVDEIFLRIVKRMEERQARIVPADRTAIGLTKGALHDTIEEFGTVPELIERIFQNDVLVGVNRMTTPEMKDLVVMYPYITEQYITLTKSRLANLQAYLNRLNKETRSNYENLKAALKLEHKNYAACDLSLVEVLLRGADNIHALLSDVRDLKKGNVYIRRNNEDQSHVENSGKKSIPIREKDARDNISDRSSYQTTLYARLDKLREESEQKGASEHGLLVFDIAKAELRATFNEAKTELMAEHEKSLSGATASDFAVQKITFGRRVLRTSARGVSNITSGARRIVASLPFF